MGICTMSQVNVGPFEPAFRRCRDLDVSLNERLGAFAEEVRKIAPVFAAKVDELIMRLQATNAGASAPGPCDLMPPFLLTDEEGRLVALPDLIKNGPVAVTFHRGHW